MFDFLIKIFLFLSVQKDAQTKSLKIVSYVFKVEVFVSVIIYFIKRFPIFNIILYYILIFKDESKTKIYPNNTVIEQDFCYLIIDPYKRHIIVLYHRFDGPLFLE